MLNHRLTALTSLTMIAFAGNSLLCRAALTHTHIDAASFTTVRLVSGALTLWVLILIRHEKTTKIGSWLSASSLFVYAAGFSFAYISLPTASGALILFGAVQTTMIGYGFWAGERLQGRQFIGLSLAFGGLVGLFLPGLSAPPLYGSMLMLGAGIGWGVYSLRGKNGADPTGITASNFIRSIPFAVVLSLCSIDNLVIDTTGIFYAIMSGAIASGIGYAIWYRVLPAMKTTSAATVQLSVPVIAAIGGVAFLGESITLRLALASGAILGGIALVILGKR